MIKKMFLALAFVLILVQFALAEVSISKPNDVYNLGDILKIEGKITGGVDGMLEINLVCDKNQLFYAEYIILAEKETQDFSKSIRLKDNKGRCYISARINDEEVSRSSSFLVSDKINLNVTLNKEYFLPKDSLIINGVATKENGDKLNGRIKVLLDGAILGEVNSSEGKFEKTLQLPELNGYDYELVIDAYDDGMMNSGELKKRIHILSVPTSVDIASNSPNAGENLDFKAFLLDQNKKEIKKELVVKVYSSNGKLLFSNKTLSGNQIIFNIPSDAKIGDWRITAEYEKIGSDKSFYITENEKIDSKISNGVLTVKNVGNIPYKKSIQISFLKDNDKVTKDIPLNLDIGEEKDFQLTAPDGEYSIGIDGVTLGKGYLTGNVIEVNSIYSLKSLKGMPLYVIIFIILLILGWLFVSGHLKRQTRFFNDLFTRETEKRQTVELKLEESNRKLVMTEQEKNRIKNIFGKYADKAIANKIIQTPNLIGEKRVVTALFIDIRGFSQLTKELGEQVVPVLNRYFKVVSDAVYQNQGVINHIEADEVFALYNAVEKQGDHVNRAVKTAIKIMKDLERINQNAEIKINVGIGINSGQVIVGKIGTDKIMKFTTIGDAINVAKRLEEKASNRIFISKNVNEIVKNIFSTRRVGIFNILNKAIEVFEVLFNENKIKDRIS